jgi:hypothetical protein
VAGVGGRRDARHRGRIAVTTARGDEQGHHGHHQQPRRTERHPETVRRGTNPRQRTFLSAL